MGNIVEVCIAVKGTPLRSESDIRQRDTSHLCCSFISFIVLVIITSTSAYSMEPGNPSISLHSGDMEQGSGLVTDIVPLRGSLAPAPGLQLSTHVHY